MNSLQPYIEHSKSEVPYFLRGGAEVGAIARAVNWSGTPLGSPELWHPNLKAAVSMMLHNKFAMYIAWGKDFTQLYNDAYRPILGSTKHPHAMGSAAEKTFPERWHVIKPLFEKAMSGQSVGSEDWMQPLDRNGFLEDCYFTFSYSPIFINEHEVGGVLITVNETTERVRTEKRLQEAHAKAEITKSDLHNLLIQAPVGIAATEGPNHIFTLTNTTYLDLFFDKNRDLVGRSVSEVAPEVAAQGFIAILDEVYKTGIPYVGTEVPLSIRQNDGSEKKFYVNFIYKAIRNQNLKITGIVSVVYDVSEQVKARTELTESEKKYRSLADSLPQMMWTSTADGNVDYANEQCLKYSGVSSQEKFGHGWINSIHEDDVARVTSAWVASINTSEVFNAEYRIKDSYGNFRWFVGRAVPIKNPEGAVQYWIGTATDFEVKKRLIEQLKAEKSLREQFVATLSHDLRSPLSAIKMSAQMIELSLKSQEKIPRFVGRIIDNVNRIDRMIENLLDAKRVTVGQKLHLGFKPFELVFFLKELIAELSTIFGERFTLDCKQQSISVNWSEDAFKRILENLCSNAVKYGAENKPISIRVFTESSHIYLAVHNLGNPIPENEWDRLFDPYSRVCPEEHSDVKGWGLGLTVVKGLVDAHNGKLKVVSDLALGTTFTIAVPTDPMSCQQTKCLEIF